MYHQIFSRGQTPNYTLTDGYINKHVNSDNVLKKLLWFPSQKKNFNKDREKFPAWFDVDAGQIPDSCE